MSPKGKSQADPGSGGDQHPKRIKEEEAEEGLLEIHPKTPETPSGTLLNKSRENGPRHPVLRQNVSKLLTPESGLSNKEGQRLVCRRGPDPRTPPNFGICRPSMEEMAHWCLECGKNFDQKAELEKHQLNHTRRHSYICSDCGRSFLDHVALTTRHGTSSTGQCFSHVGCRRRPLPPSNETAVPRKERKELSLQEKVRVLEMLEGPKVSQSELAKRFGVSQPQICRIIKNKERILAEWFKNGNPGRKRKMEEKGLHGDVSLLQWFERSGGSANGMQLQEKSRLLADAVRRPPLGANLGWLSSCKPRQKIEQPPVEKPNGEAMEEECWKNTILPDILRKYDPPNVYACSEVGLLFRATPEGLASENKEEDKDRLTVLLCANMDASDKRDPLIVGKARRPSGCPGFGVPQDLLPTMYRTHHKAWMTATIFSEWLWAFNEDVKSTQRHVVLFLAPCAAHLPAELSNVKMVFMPPNPSRCHPLEQGVIQAFKCHYRRRMLTRLVVAFNGRASMSRRRLSERLTLLDAVHLAVQAWSEVCPQTITSGYQVAGFVANPSRLLAPSADVVRALGFKNQEQFKQFVSMDEGLECFGDQEGPEIQAGQEVLCETGDEPEEEEEEEEKMDSFSLVPCPTQAEVMESLAKLRRCFECHSASSNMFQAFYKLEDMVHGMFLSRMQTLRSKALSQE
ncbi:tigger transposable element-derived protein 3-like [Sceloporus undulatus]|uniref:tigger transposable element-derived protein 3-like n=1 Tax=Sceloporus undulatus TaxID=8520 RepID=UPI001C4ABE99|nr:tigger transposable element-derived protein 3-like [Sceloporus undulatus]